MLAVAAALVPLPPALVERWFSTSIYLRLQGTMTPLSNRVPIALLDVAVGLLLLVFVWLSIARMRRIGPRRAAVRGALTLVTWSAVVYLCFLALWGLNYRRLPLQSKLDYDGSRLTPEAAVAFTGAAVGIVNRGYEAAHASPADDTALARGFADAQRILGAPVLAVPGVPKRSLLSLYFRRAAIDGMTDPIFLEIIVNPDVLPAERPFVLAHEWAHLAGYADESEANFVAWLACERGDAAARYSGWLAAYQHVVAAMPRSARRSLPPLDPGPQSDLRAMAQRYARSSPVIRDAARDVYDKYLRANRVPEGIASYDAVVRLLVGTVFDAHWTPRMR